MYVLITLAALRSYFSQCNSVSSCWDSSFSVFFLLFSNPLCVWVREHWICNTSDLSSICTCACACECVYVCASVECLLVCSYLGFFLLFLLLIRLLLPVAVVRPLDENHRIEVRECLGSPGQVAVVEEENWIQDFLEKICSHIYMPKNYTEWGWDRDAFDTYWNAHHTNKHTHTIQFEYAQSSQMLSCPQTIEAVVCFIWRHVTYAWRIDTV